MTVRETERNKQEMERREKKMKEEEGNKKEERGADGCCSSVITSDSLS